MTVPRQAIQTAIQQALQEDLSFGDVTTSTLFPTPCFAAATLVARQPAVIAGVAVADRTFLEVDPTLRVTRRLRDGSTVKNGTPILFITGDARSLLMAERVALNFLQHLSGIATLTAKFCDAVRGYRTKILDTRKTTPGLRALEKWAVKLGGGQNHRHSLADGVLIKDNHLMLAGYDAAAACRAAREKVPHGLKIEVETTTLSEVRAALDGEADIILLDNMDVPTIRQAIDLIKGRALVEVSGGVTLTNVREIAATGPDMISIGALTHSAQAVDISMDLQPIHRKTSKRTS